MTTVPTVDMVPAHLIRAGTNDRETFDRAGLEQLASSIATTGLASPPTVRPMPDGTFQLVAGERRTRACRDILGWAEMPCHVRHLSSDEAAALMLSENEARVDLNPIEQAKAYRARLDGGVTVAELSERCGIPRRRIESRLRLLSLADDIAHVVATGNLSLGAADQIADLDHNRQHLAVAGLQAGLDTGGFGALVVRLTAEQQAEPLFDPASFFQIEEYRLEAEQAAAVEQLGLFAREVTEATRRRDDGIRAMRAAGASLRRIAEVVGMTHAGVRCVLARGA
jgi:ParB family chromosome partitioning protein